MSTVSGSLAHAAFEQGGEDLVDDCRSPPYPAIMDTMERLQVQFGRQTNIIALCPNEQLLASLGLAA